MFLIYLVIRNEAEYLEQWIQYHIGLGIKKIVIIDDESKDNTEIILRPYIEQDIVLYFRDDIDPIAEKNRNKYYQILKDKYHGWYMFCIDIDEFLFLENNETLNDIVISQDITHALIIEEFICGTNDDGTKALSLIDNKYHPTHHLHVCKDRTCKGCWPWPQKAGFKSYIKINKNLDPIFIDAHNIIFPGSQKVAVEDSIKNPEMSCCKNIKFFHLNLRSLKEQQYKLKKYKKNNIGDIGAHPNQYKILDKYDSIDLINEYGKQNLTRFFNKNGYILIRKMFSQEEINNILEDAKNIYREQIKFLKIDNGCDLSDNTEFNYCLFKLFKEHFDIFLNCGKQCQHLIKLWKLQLDDRLYKYLRVFGLENPIISTRPVLFSNSKHCAKSSINHTVPEHQDWASMQGSINSIVAWIPLVDINQELGSIKVIPYSHKEGLLSFTKVENFGLVKGYKESDFVSFDMKQGDIILFNSFLVHKSGNNITDDVRWSCHMRYNDLSEKSFIERGYPHAYLYKPLEEYLTPDFDTKKEIIEYYKNIKI